MSIQILEVGYKGQGRAWCSTIERTPDCKLTGIVDIDEGVRKLAESERCVPIFPSITEAKAAVGADVAVIASPSFAHAENVQEALDNDLHVLVEKPFTLDLNEAKRLVEYAETKKRILLVSQNYRYDGESRTVRNLIKTGKVGKPEFVQIQGFNLADVDGTNYRCRLPNPHLWEMAVHQFDLVRFLFDAEVESVFCALFNPSWSWYQHSAYTNAWFELSNKIRVNYIGTYVTRGPISSWNNSWRIEGTDGTLLWREPTEIPLQYTLGPGTSPEVLPVEQFPRAGIEGTLDELLLAINRKSAFECSAKDNLNTLAICVACEISAREQRVVNVADVLSRATC